MAFFTEAISTLQTLVIALGAGLAVWGVINLLEGYGNDNPGANAHVNYTNTFENGRKLCNTLFIGGFLIFRLFCGLYKIKCSDEVIDYLYFLRVGFFIFFGYINPLDKLQQYRRVQLLQIGVLLCYSHKVFNVGFLFVAFFNVPAQRVSGSF